MVLSELYQSVGRRQSWMFAIPPSTLERVSPQLTQDQLNSFVEYSPVSGLCVNWTNLTPELKKHFKVDSDEFADFRAIVHSFLGHISSEEGERGGNRLFGEDLVVVEGVLKKNGMDPSALKKIKQDGEIRMFR